MSITLLPTARRACECASNNWAWTSPNWATFSSVHARQIAVDLALVRKARHSQVGCCRPFFSQDLVGGFGVFTAHDQTAHHRLCFMQHAVPYRFHLDLDYTFQQPKRPDFCRIFQKHHQKRRYRFFLRLCRFIRYCSHRMTSWFWFSLATQPYPTSVIFSRLYKT